MINFELNTMGAKYWEFLYGVNLLNGFAQVNLKGYVDQERTQIVSTIQRLVPFIDPDRKLVLNESDMQSLLPSILSDTSINFITEN